MADEPENVVLVYARRIDERLAGLEREFTLRMTGLEARIASRDADLPALKFALPRSKLGLTRSAIAWTASSGGWIWETPRPDPQRQPPI